MYGPFSPTGSKGVSTEFTQAADRANIASGESFETILGKMANRFKACRLGWRRGFG